MAKKAKKKVIKKAKKSPAKKASKKQAAKKAVKRSTRKKPAAKKSRASKAPKMNHEQLMKNVEGKVEGFIKKLYKKNYEKHDGRFLTFEGSTVVQTVLRPWHGDDVVVESFAYVVQEARLNEELLKFLLRENAKLHFGAFGITYDGTIIFSHALAGAHLDENEFDASLKSVAKIADHYDNQIVAMAGGMTAREAMNKGII
jgi:hypothetical protein